MSENNVNSTEEIVLSVEMGDAVSAQTAEAYAVGKRGGVDVAETDPTWHNNAKYYAEQAEEAAGEAQGAEEAAQRAEAAQAAAEAARDRAEAIGAGAVQSAAAAAESAQAAATAKTGAETAQSAAAGSATAAEGSAGRASQSATAAAGSATAAGTAKTAAEAARDAAAGSATAAAGSASAADQSAQAAAASAQAAEDVAESIPADYSQLSADVTGLKSAFEQLNDNVITDSACPAPIVSIADGADGMPMRKVEVAIEPVQDLHGYDNPWPAGGGKNLIPTPYSSPAGTYNGVTVTVNDDGTLVLNGTATASVFFNLLNSSSAIPMTAGDYVLHKPIPTAVTGVNITVVKNGSYWASAVTTSPTLMLSEDANISWYINVASGTALSNVKVYPMFERGTIVSDWSPYSNVCPISGWTGAKVMRTGKNLVDVSDQVNVTNGTKIIASGLPTGGFLTASADISDVTPDNGLARIRIQYMLNDNLVVSSNATIHSGRSVATLQIPQNATDVKIVLQRNTATTSFSAKNVMVEHGQTASTYEPYQGETYDITFPTEAGTVYGGTLDVVSGKLVVDRATVVLNGATEAWIAYTAAKTGNNFRFRTSGLVGAAFGQGINGTQKADWLAATTGDTTSGASPIVTSIRQSMTLFANQNRTYVYVPDIVSNESDIDGWKAYLAQNPLTVSYLLAEPQEITLSPTEIKTLLGVNNVWADAGNVAVTYPADTKTYIDNRINASRRLIAGIETGFTASKLYAVGDMLIIGDDLYKVTAQIASGATITVGTNVNKTTVAEQLLALANA